MRHRPPALLIAVIALVFWHLAGCGAAPVGEATSTASQELVSCPAGQTLASFQRGATNPGPVADASLRPDQPTTALGTSTVLNDGIFGTVDRTSLIRFDISTLPTGATVASATLGLTNNIAPMAGTVTAAVNSSSWVETTVTDSTAPTYGAIVASNGNSGAAGSAFAMTIPASVVQGWITGSNYGLRLDQGTGASSFLSSETSTTASRPRLDVCYTVSGPSCTDLIKNGSETDVDCGGPTCPACTVGGGCSIATDCTSGACGAASLCVAAPTCTVSTVALPTAIDAQYGATATESLSLYLPTGTPPVGGWPVVIDVHGGGFTGTGGGRNSSALTFHAQVLNAQNVALITVDYLLTASGSPHDIYPFPTAVNDLRGVACWIQANASTYAIDPTRAGWIGYSAGGGLVGVFATTLPLTTLAGGTVLATPTCSLAGSVKAWATEYGNVGMVPAEWSASNPGEWWYADSTPVGGTLPAGFLTDATVTCHASDPPLFINDGSSDTTVAPAALRRLAAQCRSVGVSTFDLLIPTGVHGYGPVQWMPAIYQPASCQLNAMALSL